MVLDGALFDSFCATLLASSLVAMTYDAKARLVQEAGSNVASGTGFLIDYFQTSA